MVGGWGSVQANWSLLFILLFAWYILIKTWERNGTLDRWNATRALGIVLMVRTQRGQKLLERLSKPRRFWRAYGELSLWVCSVSMLVVGLLVPLAFISSILSPTTTPPPSASELVAIPGINPIIPLGWGVMAFVVSLVIHELGHGLLARGHGMRIRSFGMLQLGPLPLGAFAEPQQEELFRAPRRERLRMFAAGPATNLFASLIMLIMLGSIAGSLVATDDSVHVRGIVVDQGADEAGMLPWDTLISIDGEPITSSKYFRETLALYSANDTVDVVVRHADGERETLTVTLSDTHAYRASLGTDNETLAAQGVQPGDAFLGVVGVSEATSGIDRLAGPLGPRFDTMCACEATLGQRATSVPFHLISIMLIPFDLNGVAIHPFQESLLTAGDGVVASILGTNGLLFLTSFFFWLMWVNILLGFTNLIPMVPFDGGHMLKDMVHSWLSGIKRLGRKLKLWDLHPMWVDHLSQRASSYSSLALLGMLLFTLIVPYF